MDDIADPLVRQESFEPIRTGDRPRLDEALREGHDGSAQGIGRERGDHVFRPKDI
jgi:hypothetical protein